MGWQNSVIIAKDLQPDESILCTVDLYKRISFSVLPETTDEQILNNSAIFAETLNEFSGLTKENIVSILDFLKTQEAIFSEVINIINGSRQLIKQGSDLIDYQSSFAENQKLAVSSIIELIEANR